MPANTPTGLPYPLPTEPVAEGAQAIRNLAEKLDARRIADIKPTAPAAMFDFTAIPQTTFAHLRIVASLHGDTAAAFVAGFIRFNGDTGNTYIAQRIRAQGTTAPYSLENYLYNGVPFEMPAGNLGGYLTPMVLEIPNYTEAAAGQPVTYNSGFMAGTTATNFLLQMCFAIWTPAAAISRITLLPAAGNFAVGSRATLYGLP